MVRPTIPATLEFDDGRPTEGVDVMLSEEDGNFIVRVMGLDEGATLVVDAAEFAIGYKFAHLQRSPR